MLTDAQVAVLEAVNDYCEINGQWQPNREAPLPDLLADLERPDDEIYTALADLYELGLIEGADVAEFRYPILVTGLTANGRQELPSG